MKKRKIAENVYWLGAIDWERRLFDSLVPLPDGTTYNAYLIEGSEKTALLDTVDPPMADELMGQLSGVKRIDYIVSHHSEQDHSGTIPRVLAQFPQAKVVATDKAKGLLMDLLHIPGESFITVKDGETLSLGDKTLQFIHTPWVHWPETMVVYLKEDRIPVQLRFSWFPHRHHRSLRDRPGTGVRGGQAVLCRDYDAVPHCDPEEPGKAQRI
jgi:flavorubredoxin